MLFGELLLLKFIFIYFDTLKDTKPLIFTPIKDTTSIPALRYKGVPPGLWMRVTALDNVRMMTIKIVNIIVLMSSEKR